MTKKQMIEEIKKSDAAYVNYGDFGTPVKRVEAIKDIESMDAEFFGDGEWVEVDDLSKEQRKFYSFLKRNVKNFTREHFEAWEHRAVDKYFSVGLDEVSKYESIDGQPIPYYIDDFYDMERYE